jgi:predicted GNAT superfamily acetyltransferase
MVTRPPGAETAAAAVRAAREAAERSGVEIRLLHELADLDAVYRLLVEIWRPDERNPPVTIELLRATTYAGNYLSGAYDWGELVGACFGFFGAPAGVGMHSHIAAVADRVRGRNVGFALKLHQRAWAIGHGIQTVTWTFDPLVRRNAYFNMGKLGARPRDYLVDFYGEMGDSINQGQGSDRLLVAWDLASPVVRHACAGKPVEADPRELERAAPVLIESESGQPRALRPKGLSGPLLVQIPADIESLRRAAPTTARDWRRAVRDVLGGLITEGAEVTGFAKTAGYILTFRSAK